MLPPYDVIDSFTIFNWLGLILGLFVLTEILYLSFIFLVHIAIREQSDYTFIKTMSFFVSCVIILLLPLILAAWQYVIGGIIIGCIITFSIPKYLSINIWIGKKIIKWKNRFEQGTKECGLCKTKDNIIQFKRRIKRKGIPIIEIAFICKSCAKKEKEKK